MTKDRDKAPFWALVEGTGGDVSGREQRAWFVGGCLAGFAAAMFFQPWNIPLVSRDSTLFFYVAERAAHGVAPYVSAFFPQVALSILPPALFIRVGELFGITPLAASRVASVLTFSITIGALCLATLRLTRSRFAAALATLAMLSFTWQVLFAATGSQTKTVLSMFLALTLLAMTCRRYGLAGASAAAVALCYQAGLLLPPTVLVIAGLAERRRSAVMRALAGSAVVAAAFAAYLWAGGALSAALDQSWSFPLGSGRSSEMATVSENFLVGGWMWGAGQRNTLRLLFVLSSILLAYWMARRPRAFLSGLRERPGWLFWFVAFVPILFYSATDSGGAADLMLIMPFASVIVGITVAAVIRRVLPQASPRHAVMAFVLLAALAVTGEDYLRMKRIIKWNLDEQLALGEVVGGWLDEGRAVYALGATHLLAFNRAPNWLIYASSHAVRPETGYHAFVNGPGPFVPTNSDGELPDIILWNAGLPVGWPEWLEREYVNITTPLFEEHKTQVWEKR